MAAAIDFAEVRDLDRRRGVVGRGVHVARTVLGSTRSAFQMPSRSTPDTVELDWSQRGENEPQVGAWKEGLGGREFLAEMNEHGIVGRRAQAMEPHV